MTSAAQEIRHLVSGRPGGVNLFLSRWGKLVVDYATALVPDRSDPFAKLVEDLLVDAVSQARAVSRAQTDDEVRAYVVESLIRTVRARYRDLLDARSTPEKATNSYTVEEVMARTSLTSEDISRGISEGRLRAVRADNTMRIKGGDVPGLGERHNAIAYHVSAAERELLCLHHRMDWTPEQIARISGAAPAHIENLVQTASMRIGEADARKRGSGPAPEDSEMRRYLAGRLNDDETSRFERRVVKDKAAQQRLEELRSERDLIRQLFDSPPYDLSRVAVNVRERNPHQPVAVPPAAALWVQVVGVAALLLLLHRVGAYLPPPDVRIQGHEGAVSIDNKLAPSALPGGRVVVGQTVATGPGGQVLLTIDGSNRMQLAGNTRVTLVDPRASVRQVLRLEGGEIWGDFKDSGHAFAVLAGPEGVVEVTGDGAAHFDLAAGDHAQSVLPDNLRAEQASALVAAFTAPDGKLAATRAFAALAGYRLGDGSAGVLAGDIAIKLDEVPLDDAALFRRALMALPANETATLHLRRADQVVRLPLALDNARPQLVLRVMRGSLSLRAPGLEPEQVNRNQWALLLDGQPPLIGQRGLEDFHLLRMDAAGRFKDRLHWLNVESFPLRAENSLLAVDRKLRELASRLERLRAAEVQRNGAAEIARFEEIMQGTINSARDRIKAGQPQGRDTLPGSLSDEELVRAETEIMGTIAHWKRQAENGAWPTLGAPAKTLHARIQRDRDDMAAREADLTQGLLLLDKIKDLDKAITTQEEAIAKLRTSELFDGDGTRRKALDDQIATLAATVKAGNEAKARAELLTLKLNELDQQLDDLRRKLPAVRGEVAAAELALAEIDKKLAANPYTPAALTKAETEDAAAGAAATSAAEQLKAREKELADADSALAIARTGAGNAEKDATAPTAARDRAQDILTDAVADRTAAATAVTDAKAEVDRLQAEHDALPENDPGRAALLEQLDAARKAHKEAEDALVVARKAADTAKADYDAADAKAVAAQKKVDDAKAAVKSAEDARTLAVTSRETATADKTRADKARADAATALEAMKTARTERQALDRDRASADGTLTTAKAALAKLEAEIATVDRDAEPRRVKLAEERKLMDDGTAAQGAIDELKLKRDQHQAISDDIDLRNKALSKLKDERDGVAASNYVKNYDRTRDEFRQFSARVDALEFLRGRALLEDQNFALGQKAAQDRYREAAEKVSVEAVGLLDDLCLDYAGFKLADNDADARLVREKLLNALWRLYYDPLPEGATDGATALCYYVVVQSGAGQDAVKALDDRWKLALAQVFDKTRYEAAGRLKATDLQDRKESR